MGAALQSRMRPSAQHPGAACTAGSHGGLLLLSGSQCASERKGLAHASEAGSSAKGCLPARQVQVCDSVSSCLLTRQVQVCDSVSSCLLTRQVQVCDSVLSCLLTRQVQLCDSVSSCLLTWQVQLCDTQPSCLFPRQVQLCSNPLTLMLQARTLLQLSTGL